MPFDGPAPASLPAITAALVQGRDRIASGWCRGRPYVSKWGIDGRRDLYCMVGAISSSLFGSISYLADAIDDLGMPFNEPFSVNPRQCDATSKVVGCNDFPGRTQDECVAIYDRAIELSLEAAQ